MALAESIFFTSNKELKFNENIKELEELNKNLESLTNTFNEKFAEKNEEDLSDAEKKEMEKILADIEIAQEDIQKLKETQQASIVKFTELVEQTKKKLGIQ